MTTTTAIYIGSVFLALLSIALFLLAVRRMVRREIAVVSQMTDVVSQMLIRYDERLASFAQTLHDALESQRPPELEAVFDAQPQAHDAREALLRTLELAVERTGADAAVAVLAAASGSPTVASVRLSQEETTHVSRIGLPEPHGARAMQVSFNGETVAPAGVAPVRSGLFVSLLGERDASSTIAVLTRSMSRHFTDDDVAGLEAIVAETRPSLEHALALQAPDPVPAIDPLTELYDRQSFVAILDREIARARTGRYPLSILIADVDRLTTLNARVGRLVADNVLAEIAHIIRDVTGQSGLPSRVGGGRFSILLPNGVASSSESLFERFREALSLRQAGEEGQVTVSAGIAELTQSDDPGSFVARANAALAVAKRAGPGTVARSE